MATHSSTRAWKIPWTEDPSELQSVVHDQDQEGKYIYVVLPVNFTEE